jgi:hypothetical protein
MRDVGSERWPQRFIPIQTVKSAEVESKADRVCLDLRTIISATQHAQVREHLPPRVRIGDRPLELGV